MALKNKLGITDSAELACEEERISKKKAVELFESDALDTLDTGTFAALSGIHRCLFGEIYDFAGKIRKVNLAKGNFRFAPVCICGKRCGILSVCRNRHLTRSWRNTSR